VCEIAELMVETLLGYRDRGVYLLHAFVIMPDHIHLLLTPNTTTSLEKAVQFIKGGSSHRIGKLRGSKSEIWQVGFHDWTVRDGGDWNAKAEYIHLNPVRARLVERAEDWPYSSASGRFQLDDAPERFKLSSGAKAQEVAALTLGLKPQPPKEQSAAEKHKGLPLNAKAAGQI
jgi:putative transposase